MEAGCGACDEAEVAGGMLTHAACMRANCRRLTRPATTLDIESMLCAQPHQGLTKNPAGMRGAANSLHVRWWAYGLLPSPRTTGAPGRPRRECARWRSPSRGQATTGGASQTWGPCSCRKIHTCRKSGVWRLAPGREQLGGSASGYGGGGSLQGGAGASAQTAKQGTGGLPGEAVTTREPHAYSRRLELPSRLNESFRYTRLIGTCGVG